MIRVYFDFINYLVSGRLFGIEFIYLDNVKVKVKSDVYIDVLEV